MAGKRTLLLLTIGLLMAAMGVAFASQISNWREPQDPYRRERRSRGGYGGRDYRDPSDRGGVPEWEVDRNFKDDVFTFVRIRYTSAWHRWGPADWLVDYPDSDLNFSYRLQELTSLKVDPKGIILDLTDERLFDYPFIYVIEPGRMALTDAEAKGLRQYLLRGGFMMVDDFWDDVWPEWANFEREIRRIFPDCELRELEIDHPIFHWVYDLKEKPLIPDIGRWRGRYRRGWGGDGLPHYWGLFDDKGRMMSFICHNTDLGDGWEREGENEQYFKEISERWAYPLGINIVVYAMTN